MLVNTVEDESRLSISSLQITSGCAWDVAQALERIVDLFDENEELRYQYFKQVWQEMNLGLIYCGREYFRELHEFTEDLLEIVKQHMLSPHNQAHRAAAIYLLYGLYFKQALVEKVRVRVTKSEFRDLLQFLQMCREEQHWDLIYVWKKLIKDRAFYWSATGTTCTVSTHGHGFLGLSFLIV